MTIPIEAIYNRNRFPSGPYLLFLLLYTPLGLVIFVLRVFISLQLFVASSILPHNTVIRRVVLRALYSVLGLVVQEEDVEKKDHTCRIITTNHITPFDHLAVSMVLPCVTPSVYDLPSVLSSLLCYRDLGVTQGREALRTNARSYLSDSSNPPLLLHPEGATTSGELALMKFGSWAFEFNGSVLVAGIRVWRIPLLPVAPSVLGASWVADLCFMLFSPVTVFTIKYIGNMRRGESESAEEFAARVQSASAASLSVKTTNHTVADKVEFMKRLAREAAAAANPMLSPEVHIMAQQVQEVLPHISLDQIKRDLVRTQNVDQTITNFLEGNVPEPIPEPRPATPSPVVSSPTPPPATPTTSHPHTSSPTNSASKSTLETATSLAGSSEANVSLNTAAKSFGKSATERMTSFQTRKAQLIENARRKYIEKHGLQLPRNNC
ncbi:lipid droplet-regulating VLDL assembly factor AUP1-like [Penaeus japonicus]|uniref:lipid droplet-regulating VLDL assembly factor AUP1-like n=1 Tax=Penaeus japonicus TaxID=27405 RepID=UPI001C710E5C|nr:lipid droplet-regulating VLDL assembly factor AUP1-like [Penaeus japonicus]